MPSLKIKLPKNAGEMTYVLSGDRITVGRRPSNTIQIEDRSVSAHHAEFIATNGHYRLHDLGSTNLTCVEGEPVRDFHLLVPCKLLFGTIEAEYSPLTPAAHADARAETVPTRAELEFLRRENLDLHSKVASLQKQVDIMGSARLVRNNASQPVVSPEAHQRLLVERDQLLEENAALKLDAENSRCDITALMRDRDAMRQAWETVKAELAAVPAGAPPVEPVPATLAPVVPVAPASPEDWSLEITRVVTRAPELTGAIRKAVEACLRDTTNEEARRDLLMQTEALASCTNGIVGHPVQRLASAMDFYLSDLAQRPGVLNADALHPVVQAALLIPALLEPMALLRAKELRRPRVLALDDDPELLSTLIASLEMADLKIVGRSTAAGALSELRGRSFDLIFLDIDMPDANGLDVCSEIRALPGYRLAPIVFLSGCDTPDNRAQAKRNGGSDFISKPFNILDLTLRAETWITRHQFGLL